MTRTAQAELELIAQNPDAPALNLPADGTSVASGSVLLTWDASPLAKTYSVEIATDNTFTNLVETATDLTGTNYQTAKLPASTTYYWRVSGSNGCGRGSFFSAIYFFNMV